MKTKFSNFVHEFEDENGTTRYAVGEWIESSGQYQRPLDKRTAELTGCSAEFAKTPAGLGGYKTRTQALRRARYLFGQKEQSND